MNKTSAGVRALSFLIVTLALYLLLWQLLSGLFALPVYFYGRLIECLALGLFVALALATPMRFEEMGIVSTRRTLFCSLALGGALALFAVCLLALVGHLRGCDPFFAWHLTDDISRVTYFIVASLKNNFIFNF